jgi:hypothetical protein
MGTPSSANRCGTNVSPAATENVTSPRTPAGRQALRARERIAARMNDELLRGLTPSERTTLQRLLRKAAAALGPDA